jgi:hypothetical protein
MKNLREVLEGGGFASTIIRCLFACSKNLHLAACAGGERYLPFKHGVIQRKQNCAAISRTAQRIVAGTIDLEAGCLVVCFWYQRYAGVVSQ